eukprot:884040_1
MQRLLCKNIAFSHINRLIGIQKNRCLNQSDVDELPARCQPKHALKQLKCKWNEQRHKNPHNPSLLHATFSFINSKYRYVLLVLLDCVYWGSLAANIVFLQLILQYIAHESAMTKQQAYLCACGMALCVFMVPLTAHFTLYQLHLQCTNIRTAMTAMIYEKALKIPNDIYSTSQIINFMSDDIQKFEDFFVNLACALGSVMLIVILVYFTCTTGKLYILTGSVLLLFMIPVFGITAPLFAKYKANIVSHTDARLKLIKEAVNGYIVTKMYAWEASILQLVQDTRKQEVAYLIQKGKIAALNMAVMVLSETVILAVVMLWYFWDHGVLYVSMIYPVLLLYDSIKLAFVYFVPTTIQAYYELKVSMKRIVDFLETPELSVVTPNHSDSSMCPSIRINTVSFYWPQTQMVTKHNREFLMSKCALSRINLSFEGNMLVGVIGKVGSGKTALFLSILGELKTDEDDVSISGKIGYCSQCPWIFNGSVKENILFGNTFDAEWYEEVVYACCLEKDFADLPHRDETIIGERGINLSGGQKTRVNLARCIYDKPSLLLVDDCFSSVDPVVANHIFVNLFHNETGLMKHTLRLLVSHQIHILSQTDQIVIMQNQKIAHIDQYTNLQQNAYINFMDLTSVNDDSFSPFEKHHQSKLINHNYNDYVIEMKENNSESLHLLAKKQSVIDHEDSVTGAVPFSCYLALLFPNTKKYSKQVIQFVAFVIIMLIPSICVTSANFWLGIWASAPMEQQSNTKYMVIYLVLIAVTVLSECIRIYTIYMTLFAGALVLHSNMFHAVLYSGVHFYEANPVGRILNRFSQDQYNIDEKLPNSFAMSIVIAAGLITGVFVLFFVTPMLYIAIIPLYTIIGMAIKLYLPLSTSLKRLEAVAISPIYSYFTVSFAGLSSIRSYKKQTYVLDKACGYIGAHAAVSLSSFATQGWLGFRVNTTFAIALNISCFVSIYLSNTVSAASVGIMMIYFFIGFSKLTSCIRKIAEVESHMTSTERVIEYGDLTAEEDEMKMHRTQRIHPHKTWPKRGDIEIHRWTVSYRLYLEPVLNEISVCIKHGERIGIVGRTGSGKTTLFKSLFRLIKPHENEGYIKIDGHNIWDIPLNDLRKALFVIPQNCILFSATLRYNIDPFNEYSDEKLHQILNEVSLNLDEMGIDLDSVMTEYGGNLSFGQTQLICVARALLNYSKHKILLIDEATANIDPHTDQIIQNLFQSKLFKNKTVLTISHRITNVMHYDKILVLDSGYLKEVGTPQGLLQDEDSMFYKMYNKII